MKIRKLMLSALAAILLCFLFPGSSEAAPYTYKVRLYAGVQGEFTEENLGGLVTLDEAEGSYKMSLEDGVVVIEGLTGGRVTFSQNAVIMGEDSKYYARGIRESGKDNSTAADQAPSFQVTKDQDYVVAYGLKKGQVAYYVRYVDASGKELLATETFYGNIDDRIIVAYRYIDGYTPDAYNKALTLKENADENMFTFTYHVRNTGENVTVNRTYIDDGTVIGDPTIINGGTTAAGNPNAVDGGTTVVEGDAGDGGAAGEGAGANAGEGAEAGGDEVEISDEETPLELQDLDDEEIPLVDFNLGDKLKEISDASFLGKLPLAARVAIILAAVAIIGAAGWFLFFARKKEKESAGSRR